MYRKIECALDNYESVKVKYIYACLKSMVQLLNVLSTSHVAVSLIIILIDTAISFPVYHLNKRKRIKSALFII